MIMRYETVADIYSANEEARKNLKAVVEGISDAEADTLPEGDTWTIQQVVEHLSMVDIGISRICAQIARTSKNSRKIVGWNR